jgi:hypothetical protein
MHNANTIAIRENNKLIAEQSGDAAVAERKFRAAAWRWLFRSTLMRF